MVNLPRVSMLPDERYPIAVSPDEFPTVPQLPATQVPLPASPTSSVQVPQRAELSSNNFRDVSSTKPNDAASPVSTIGSSFSMGSSAASGTTVGSSILSRSETATNSLSESQTSYKSDPTMYKGEDNWRAPAFDSELLRAPKRSTSFWRQFNVWKVIFFGVLAFVTGVVITTVVLNNKMKTSSSKAAAPATSVSNTTTTTTTKSPFPTDVASITSSGLFLRDEKTWNSQVYYQPQNTTNIMYRMSLADGSSGGEVFEKERQMSISYVPRIASPLSATATTDSTGVVYLNIFYVTSTNSIAQASMACPINSAVCRTTSNLVISKGAQDLHSESGLAVVNVNNAQDWRIYYHNTDRNIVELEGNASGFNQGVTIYNGTALMGSYLTAVNVEGSDMNNINVFFVDHDSKALFYTQFTDAWQKAQPITNAVVTHWNPTSRLASAFTSTLNEMRVYFIGSDSNVAEFVGYNATSTNATWEDQAQTATTWTPSTSITQDITAVAFEDQVRWWQYQPTGLVEAALNEDNWVESRVL